MKEEGFHIDSRYKDKSAYYNGLLLAKYNYSETLKVWYIYMTNISFVVHQVNTEEEVMPFVKAEFKTWLSDED